MQRSHQAAVINKIKPKGREGKKMCSAAHIQEAAAFLPRKARLVTYVENQAPAKKTKNCGNAVTQITHSR